MDKLLYVIILNYEGCEDTLFLIESVKKSTYSNYKILVVDNGSKEKSKYKIKKSFPEVEFIQLERNLGYAGGNNVGISYALGQKAEFICLLNNDTEVAPDTFEKLISQMHDQDIGIIGPSTLFWNSNKIHSTGLKFNFYKGTGKLLNYNKQLCDVLPYKIECDYLEGTCLLFHISLISIVGYIPEYYFLYYEENEWCCNIRKRGLKVICFPQASVWHKGSASTNKISGLKMYFEDRNRFLFEKRNAPKNARMFFYVYFCLQLSYRLFTGKRNKSSLLAVKDGLKGTFRENYVK